MPSTLMLPVFQATLEPIDLLFAGIAAFEGLVLTRRVAASRG